MQMPLDKSKTSANVLKASLDERGKKSTVEKEWT